MTLDDLERPKRTLAEENSVYGAHQEKMNEGRHILSAAKYRPMILVSRNVRHVQIFAGVPQGGCVVEVRNFCRLLLAIYMLGNFRHDMQDIIIRKIYSPSAAFQ